MSTASNDEIKFFDIDGNEIRNVHRIHRVDHKRPTNSSEVDVYTVSYVSKGDRERIIRVEVAQFSYQYAKAIWKA